MTHVFPSRHAARVRHAPTRRADASRTLCSSLEQTEAWAQGSPNSCRSCLQPGARPRGELGPCACTPFRRRRAGRGRAGQRGGRYASGESPGRATRAERQNPCGDQPVSPEIHSVTLMFFFCKFAKCGFGVHFCGFGVHFCGFGGDFCGFRVHFCGFRVHLPVAYLPATTVPARWTTGQLWR